MRHQQRHSLQASIVIGLISGLSVLGLSTILVDLFPSVGPNYLVVIMLLAASAVVSFVLFHTWIEPAIAGLIFSLGMIYVTQIFGSVGTYSSGDITLLIESFLGIFALFFIGATIGAFVRASLHSRR